MDIQTTIQNHWLWKDKPFAKGQAWIDLLLLADSKSIFFRNKEYRLPKGQLISSENELAKIICSDLISKNNSGREYEKS